MAVRFRVVKKNGQEVVEEIHKVVVHRFKLLRDIIMPPTLH